MGADAGINSASGYPLTIASFAVASRCAQACTSPLHQTQPAQPGITGKSDKLFDVRVRVVPKLDGVREVELMTCGHEEFENKTGTSSRAR